MNGEGLKQGFAPIRLPRAGWVVCGVPVLESSNRSAAFLDQLNFPANRTPGGLPLSPYIHAIGVRTRSPTGSLIGEALTTLSNLVHRVPSVLDYFFLTNAQVQLRTSAAVTALARTIALRRGDDRARSVAAAWVAARLPAAHGPDWLAAGNDRWLVNSLRSSTNAAVVGRRSFPVNVIYVPGSAEPIVLEEILTVANVTAALNKIR